MQVYVEYAVLDNLIIDYYLLKATAFLCGKKVNRLRLILTSVFSCAMAVCLPLFSIPQKLNVFVKIFLAFVIILLYGEYKSFREYFFLLAVFVFLTFLSGGAVIAVLYALNLDYVLKGGYVSYKFNFPLSVILLASVLCSQGVVKVAKAIYKKKTFYPFVRDCVIYIGKKSFHFTGFLDSGNRLFDKKSGKPIVIISKNAFYKTGLYEYLTSSYGYVNFSTVGGGGKMRLYELEKMQISNEYYCREVILAVSEINYTEDYDVILHPALVCG